MGWKPTSKAFSYPTVMFFLWIILVYGSFAAVGRLFQPGQYVYEFFFDRGPIQYVSTALFWCAVILLITKHLTLKGELRSVRRLRIQGMLIPQEKAEELAEVIVPPPERRTRVGQAAYQVCKGYGKGKDVDALVETQMEKIRVDSQRSYQIFNVLKQVLPLLGFLGTVIGLSAGMIAFSQFSGLGTDVVDLRNHLKIFAGSLSSAFDTTLLALGYTVILILATAIVRKREESLLSAFEQTLREKLAKRFSDPVTPMRQWTKAMEELTHAIGAKFESIFAQTAAHTLSIFERRMNNGISEVVSGWVSNYHQALVRGTELLVEKINLQNRELGESFTRGMQDNMGQVVQGLQKVELAALRRPRIEIITREDSRVG